MTLSRISRLIALTWMMVFSANAQIPPQTPPNTPNANPVANPNTIRPSVPQATRPPRPSPPPINANANRPGTPSPAPGAASPTPAAAAKPGSTPPTTPVAASESTGISVQFPNNPIGEVLYLYEELTGLKIIRDANAGTATVSIETTGELPKEQAIQYIEKSLLLNGYAFVPAGEGMVKLLAFDAKKPQGEGVPLITTALDLPETDAVVSHVVNLRYLTTEKAIEAIDQVIPRHSYGLITPVPNAKSLVITENSNTIRSILGLLEELDNKPAEVVQKSFQLERADAEEIATTLDEILSSDDENGSGSRANRPTTNPALQAGQVPGQAVAAAQPGISVTSPSGQQSEEVPPKIIAIPRTNKVLVIAMPETMEVIEALITELDAPADLRNFVSRTLNYLGVDDALSIISDAITRGQGDGSGNLLSGGTQAGQNRTNTTNTTNQNNSFNNNRSNSLTGGLNSSLGGIGGGLGGGGFSSGSSGGSLTPLRQGGGPRSLVIGKTLLIADPIANSIFASGPPEHLRVLNEIMDELDQRPQQVVINVVIGQMSLSDDVSFGVQALLQRTLNLGRGSAVAGGLGDANGAYFDPRSTTATTTTGGATTAVSTLAALAGGSGLSFYGGIRDGMDVILNTLQTHSDFQVLSRPTLFTMNNQPATISSGSSFPIATSTQSGLIGGSGLISNVQYQPVELNLQIIPLINSPDELTLQVQQSNSEAGENVLVAGNPYPTLTQQQLNTTVIVKNRSTVLLGGLIREDANKSRNGIPVLSSIPLLKYLTGSRSKSSKRSELLVFIQPRIVTGYGDLPSSVEDSPGASPLGDEMRRMFDEEKSVPPVDEVKRTKLGRLIQKLFY